MDRLERRLCHWGLGAGAVAALLDVSLIATVQPSGSGYALLEASLFWLGTGFAVVASQSSLGHRAHGVLVTLFLSLPWYVLYGPAADQVLHLPPLVLMGVVFGLGFGWARSRARVSPAEREA